jgi:xanthine dehydrogenase accessory factor
MTELEAIVAAALRVRKNGSEAVLATVVDTAGSAYRQPGARMLVTGQGWQAGSISGGCLEGDIIKRGAWLTMERRAVMVTYDSTDDDDIVHGFGLGCRGVVQVLVERIGAPAGKPDMIGFLAEVLAAREAAVIATILHAEGDPGATGQRLYYRGDGNLMHDLSDRTHLALLQREAEQGLRRAASMTATFPSAAGTVQVFIEYIRPPTPLKIFGAGHDAIPLVALAKSCGFHVTIIDGRPSYANATHFPQVDQVIMCAPAEVSARIGFNTSDMAVIMTHNYLADRALLRTLLTSPVSYIGVLGPKRRTGEMLSDLHEEGLACTDAQLKRLHAPVGLDIGAERPEHVALSIIAEIQAVLTGRLGGYLKDRIGSIHPCSAAGSHARQTGQPLDVACPSLP